MKFGWLLPSLFVTSMNASVMVPFGVDDSPFDLAVAACDLQLDLRAIGRVDRDLGGRTPRALRVIALIVAATHHVDGANDIAT